MLRTPQSRVGMDLDTQHCGPIAPIGFLYDSLSPSPGLDIKPSFKIFLSQVVILLSGNGNNSILFIV